MDQIRWQPETQELSQNARKPTFLRYFSIFNYRNNVKMKTRNTKFIVVDNYLLYFSCAVVNDVSNGCHVEGGGEGLVSESGTRRWRANIVLLFSENCFHFHDNFVLMSEKEPASRLVVGFYFFLFL